LFLNPFTLSIAATLLVINFFRLVLRKTPREGESTPVKSFICKKKKNRKEGYNAGIQGEAGRAIREVTKLLFLFH
jgi:hypothetical protein